MLRECLSAGMLGNHKIYVNIYVAKVKDKRKSFLKAGSLEWSTAMV